MQIFIAITSVKYALTSPFILFWKVECNLYSQYTYHLQTQVNIMVRPNSKLDYKLKATRKQHENISAQTLL